VLEGGDRFHRSAAGGDAPVLRRDVGGPGVGRGQGRGARASLRLRARVLVDFTLPADWWDPGLVQPRTRGDRWWEHAHVPTDFGDEHLNDSLAERPQEVCGWERVADLVVKHRESIVYI